MKRQQIQQREERLSFKTLDKQFQKEALDGLKCSPIEAKALTQIVKEVYFPLFEDKDISNIRPGQIVVQAVDLEEPPGKPIKQCKFKHVILTIDKGLGDLKIRLEKGIIELRRERIKRITKEAFEQGALLTAEDLAYRVFNAGYRTIIRDLKNIREEGVTLPLRSTQQDIGRTTTHKEQIVKLWLQGHEPAYISRATNHSVEAVSGYLEPFKRVIALTIEGRDIASIAFVLRVSRSLVVAYQKLFEEYKGEALGMRIKELEHFLKSRESAEVKEVNVKWT